MYKWEFEILSSESIVWSQPHTHSPSCKPRVSNSGASVNEILDWISCSPATMFVVVNRVGKQNTNIQTLIPLSFCIRQGKWRSAPSRVPPTNERNLWCGYLSHSINKEDNYYNRKMLKFVYSSFLIQVWAMYR